MAYRNLAQGLETPIVAFDGDRLLARGPAGEVALAVKRRIEAAPKAQILIFDEETSYPAEIDLTGSDGDILEWVSMWAGRKDYTKEIRPVERTVTLLPRHWDWLDDQPGGASAALRRLVEEARKSPKDAARRTQEATYRFILTMAGDREGFEDASRALFANDAERFAAATQSWPKDIRDHALHLWTSR
jgi:hypothetical protein